MNFVSSFFALLPQVYSYKRLSVVSNCRITKLANHHHWHNHICSIYLTRMEMLMHQVKIKGRNLYELLKTRNNWYRLQSLWEGAIRSKMKPGCDISPSPVFKRRICQTNQGGEEGEVKDSVLSKRIKKYLEENRIKVVLYMGKRTLSLDDMGRMFQSLCTTYPEYSIRDLASFKVQVLFQSQGCCDSPECICFPPVFLRWKQSSEMQMCSSVHSGECLITKTMNAAET